MVEGCTSGTRLDCPRVDAELSIVRRQQLVPSRLTLSIRNRSGVTEEIDVVGPGRGGGDRHDGVAKRVWRQHCPGERPETACLRYRDRERGTLNASHRRLDERESYSEP